MNTPRTSALIQLVGQYGVQCSETKELAPNQELSAAFNDVVQLETEVQELRAALEELLGWSESIKGCAVTPSVVDNGEIFKEARAALAKVPK